MQGGIAMAGRTFFVADTHFGHEAMIRFENRPFENTKDMERQLIKNWNEVVDSEDRVYVLGILPLAIRQR